MDGTRSLTKTQRKQKYEFVHSRLLSPSKAILSHSWSRPKRSGRKNRKIWRTQTGSHVWIEMNKSNKAKLLAFVIKSSFGQNVTIRAQKGEKFIVALRKDVGTTQTRAEIFVGPKSSNRMGCLTSERTDLIKEVLQVPHIWSFPESRWGEKGYIVNECNRNLNCLFKVAKNLLKWTVHKP